MTTKPIKLTKNITELQMHVEFELKFQDLWIGLYWKRQGNCFDAWICFLPCLPLHFSCWWHNPKQ